MTAKPLSDGWRTMRFTDAVTVNPSVSLEKGKVYPFVEMAAVDPGARSVRESERRAFKSGGARFAPGDTLMARITPCLENGKIARFRPSDETSIGFGSTEFIVIRGREDVTTDDFAYYLTKWPEFRQFAIGQMTGSSGRQRVPADSLAGFEAAIPPLSAQQRIADVLGKLDDKIELNRRMNRTLEKMAAAIFKSFFLDFAPVHAKAEGRDPNLPAEIADLFPDTFEDSDLGPIPKRWTCSTIGDEFNLTMGQSPPGETYNESREGVPFFQGRRDFGLRYPTNRVYCTAPTRCAAKGDTLMSVRAPVGDVNMALERCSIGRGVAAARHKSTSVSYTYYAFRSLKERFDVYNGEGTVFGSISQKDLRAIPWLAPDSRVVSRFHELVNPIDQRIELNELQNRRLAGLRDTLLPKLLSGEIEIPVAESVAEEVV